MGIGLTAPFILSRISKAFKKKTPPIELTAKKDFINQVAQTVSPPQKQIDMQFNFKNVFAQAAAAWRKLEDEVKTKIAVILTIGSTLLTILSKKGVIDVIGLISPQMRAEIPLIDKYLAQAIIALTAVEGVLSIEQAPDESDEDFLKAVVSAVLTDVQNTNILAQHAFIAKLMQILLGIVDGNKQPEHVYDTTIQTAITHSKLQSL